MKKFDVSCSFCSYVVDGNACISQIIQKKESHKISNVTRFEILFENFPLALSVGIAISIDQIYTTALN